MPTEAESINVTLTMRFTAFGLLISILTSFTAVVRAEDGAMIRGADVSMLIELEQAGAKYYATSVSTDSIDPIQILKDNGVDWFRLRLFVDPSDDYASTWGATQDIDQVRALAKRVRRVGGKILLDLHYSDTWADGVKQMKPKAWAGQDFSTLENTVYNYTRRVLRQLNDDGAMPDMVQIGNEIAGGMLYPDAQLYNVKPEARANQWAKLSKILNAGANAVREMSTAEHPIRVMIHIHGGGHEGVPMSFFDQLAANPVDFDVIGLSFYPAWGDSIENLTINLAALEERFHKPVILAEVAYPAKDIGTVKEPKLLKWPLLPAGQVEFTRDLLKTVRASKSCNGMFWWYPEAVPMRHKFLWRDGAEAFFDEAGRPRPALATFGRE